MMPIRGIALFGCYSLAPLLLGFALAVATVGAMYPGRIEILRPLIVASALLLLILVGWFSMPNNRPRLGALGMQVTMMWSLIAGAGIVRLHIHGEPVHQSEWIALTI